MVYNIFEMINCLLDFNSTILDTTLDQANVVDILIIFIW